MNQNNLLLIAAAGVVLYKVQSEAAKKARAAAVAKAPGQSTAASPVANNVNNEMWRGILGSAWKDLVQQNASGDTGSFFMRNILGEVTTSDGKPVDSTSQAISVALSGDAAGPGGIVSTAAPDGTDYLYFMGW